MTDLPMDRVREILRDAEREGDPKRSADCPASEVATLCRMVLALVEELSAERERRGSTITCAFCFSTYPAGDDEEAISATREHVMACKEHPAAALREQLTTLTAQRDEAVGLVALAFREGYEEGCDPAYADKQLRRAGVSVETHTREAREFFWNRSEAKERLAALTTPTGGTDA